MTLAKVQVKWSVILIDRLSPDIFSTLRMQGHVLHRARAHLKVPSWSLVWNTLLTKNYLCFCRVWMKLMEVAKRFYLCRDNFEVIWFYCVIVRVKCEGEWNSIVVVSSLSAFESLYGGQFTLSTQLIKPNYLVILPTDADHSFFRNLPLYSISKEAV